MSNFSVDSMLSSSSRFSSQEVESEDVVTNVVPDVEISVVDKGKGKKGKAKGRPAKPKPVELLDDDKMELIELWEGEECLYDNTIADYSRSDKRAAAINRILTYMKLTRSELTEADIKRSLRHLRTYFQKEKRKIADSKPSGSGTGDVYVPTWKFYKRLEFLSPFCEAHETDSNIEKRKVDDLSGSDDNEECQVVEKKTPQRREKKAKLASPSDQIILQCSELLSKTVQKDEAARHHAPAPPPQEDEDTLFGKTMAHMAREIKDPVSKGFAKLEAQRIMFQYRFQNTYGSNNTGVPTANNLYMSTPPSTSHHGASATQTNQFLNFDMMLPK